MAEPVAFADIKTGDIISFTTYGNSIIPNIVDATVIAIESGIGVVNPTQAAANAANIFPSIPVNPGIPLSADYTTYVYLRLKLQNDTQVEIAEPWINPVSLTRLFRQTALVVIPDYDISRSEALRNLLAAEFGFINITITLGS